MKSNTTFSLIYESSASFECSPLAGVDYLLGPERPLPQACRVGFGSATVVRTQPIETTNRDECVLPLSASSGLIVLEKGGH